MQKSVQPIQLDIVDIMWYLHCYNNVQHCSQNMGE